MAEEGEEEAPPLPECSQLRVYVGAGVFEKEGADGATKLDAAQVAAQTGSTRTQLRVEFSRVHHGGFCLSPHCYFQFCKISFNAMNLTYFRSSE